MRWSKFATVSVISFSLGFAKPLADFDAQTQYVDVSDSGPHAFTPPGPGDMRGPCPGLNAMANHGFIPHNGMVDVLTAATASNEVFGLGIEFGILISQYAALVSGNVLSFSIGAIRRPDGQCLGGLSCSHNRFEGDVSPTRCDLYQCPDRDVDSLRLSQWEDLYTLPAYDIPSLTDLRARRFNESIYNNPYFFNGPLTGPFIQPATYTFIFRLMANKSVQYPEGFLDEQVLKSFFSISGDVGNFNYTPGHERIPYNWYKRATSDEYSLPVYLEDILDAASKYPQFLDIGGNTGTPNSFTGIDIANLTNGVYNVETLLQGDNLVCFVLEFAQSIVPSILGSLLSLLGILCPELATFNATLLEPFPGYTKKSMGGV